MPSSASPTTKSSNSHPAFQESTFLSPNIRIRHVWRESSLPPSPPFQLTNRKTPNYTDKPRRYLWCNRNDIYFLEDGVLKKNSYARLPNSILGEEKAIFLSELEATGYRSKNPYVANLLDSFINQTLEDLMAEASRRGVKNARKRMPRVDEEKKWRALNKRFDGQIIMLDKKSVRITETGFAVRILMKSGSVEEKRIFIKENRHDILKWCREELQASEAIMNRIGDLKEYKATGYKLLQSSEMEILFQKK